MSAVLLLSVAIRVAAFAGSFPLWRRLRDWRAGFITATLGAMVVVDAVHLIGEAAAGAGVRLGPDEAALAHFAVSVLALAGVVFINQMLREAERVRQQRQLERTYLEQLFKSSPEAVVLLDNEDRILRANPQFTAIFGYDVDEALGRRINDLIVPEDRKDEGLRLTMTVAGGQPVSVETVRQRKDGTPVDVSILGTPITLAPRGQIAVYGIYRDITARKQAERAQRESEERYVLAAEGAHDGLWDWDLRTGKIYYSPRWQEQLGYKDGEIAPLPDEWFRRVHPDDLPLLRANLDAHLAGTSPHFESEHRMQHQDGEYRWMLSRGIAVRGENGEPYRIAGSQTDVTERKSVEQRLQHDAFHDMLTGLPNRALFMDRLTHALQRANRRGEYLFAVLFLDLDRFKAVNDALGHATGDKLLVTMGQRLNTCIRPGDTVARLGGDEFVVLLEDIEDEADAIRVTERIQTAVGRPLLLDGHEVLTTVSIGVALSAQGYERPEDLLRDADLAMYRAKALGKSRHEVFDVRMQETAVERLSLETDLRRAAKRDELVLHYQPIVSLEDGVVRGFEALLRWHHPERGLLRPDAFVPLAEETGLILPIGLWVLEQATRQMRSWQEEYPAARQARVHVNLSGRQFRQRDLVPQIRGILGRTGLDARCLCLEIAENVVMDDAEVASRLLAELHTLNVGLQIDDFGTGYSSLSYLHRFPIDTLKIDRSFVMRMGEHGENSGIVRSIISLARDLGVDVIAEGVEEADHVEHLRLLGCTMGQGMYLADPIPAEEAVTFLGTSWRAAV